MITLAPQPDETVWRGGYNTYLTVWGEYERSHGWSFRKHVCDNFIKLTISIMEKRASRGRRVPVSWSAALQVNGKSISLPEELGGQPTRGRCRSLKDARQQADLIPDDAVIREAALQNWDLGRVECVYRMEGGEPVPFMTTSFCTNLCDITSGRGRLIVLPSRNKRKHNLGRGWVVDCCLGGYTARGPDKDDEMPEPWI